MGNLAFACPRFNRYKGPTIAGLDLQSGDVVRLFHPRTDDWVEHFQFLYAFLAGKTQVGRGSHDALRGGFTSFGYGRLGS